MNYMLIKVHSFACDFPGCSEEEEHAESYKVDALLRLLKDGWTTRNRKYYCPEHSVAPTVNAIPAPGALAGTEVA